MFYELIRNKRDDWYAEPDCTAQSIIAYIIERDQMRIRNICGDETTFVL